MEMEIQGRRLEQLGESGILPPRTVWRRRSLLHVQWNFAFRGLAVMIVSASFMRVTAIGRRMQERKRLG